MGAKRVICFGKEKRGLAGPRWVWYDHFTIKHGRVMPGHFWERLVLAGLFFIITGMVGPGNASLVAWGPRGVWKVGGLQDRTSGVG